MTTTLIPIGDVTLTPNVKSTINYQEVFTCIQRHEQGDWGDISDDEKQINEAALNHHNMLVSSYTLQSDTLVITTNPDRTQTQAMLLREFT